MKPLLSGHGRRNTTVAAIRQYATLTGSRDGIAAKQPGRRFGPAPTRSKQWRAGSRRTKQEARAAR